MAQMTDAQRLFFETNGYLVVEDALAPQQLDFLRQIAGDAEERWRRTPEAGGCRDPHFEQVAGIMEYHPAFLDLAMHPRVFPLVCEAVGPDVQLLDHAYYMTQPGAEVDGTAWHTDVGKRIFGVYHPRSVVMVRAFYVLDDVGEDGGATLVLPGSHHYPEDFVVPRVEWPELMPSCVRLAVKAGSAYFLNGNLLHAPSNHRGKSTRRVVLFNYGHRWMRMWKGHEPSEWLLSLADTPMKQQLLGQWRAYYGKDADLETAGGPWFR